MGLTTILRGFKVPVAILDRFFEANGVMPTEGYPPHYYRARRLPYDPPDDFATQDPHSAFLRAKLAAATTTTPAGAGSQNTRFFIPNREGSLRSTHAYVSYAYVMVFCQRQLDVAGELPDQAPPGFAELRREILGFANDDEQGLLQAPGMQPPAGLGQDPASMLFVVVTDEREYPWKGPFLRDSDRCCDQCAEELDSWLSLQQHREEVHGVISKRGVLPDDL